MGWWWIDGLVNEWWMVYRWVDGWIKKWVGEEVSDLISGFF